MKLTVFFSWQSETDKLGYTNRSLIIDAIHGAFKDIQNTGQLKGVFFELKEGLTNVPGTPDVAEKMFEHADNCDIFIGDYTIVDRSNKFFDWLKKLWPKKLSFRKEPNSNVIGEYSRAQRNNKTFYKQTILVANDVNGTPAEDSNLIPFDFRGNRWPIFFTLEDNSAEKRKDATKKLRNELKNALKACAFPAIEYRLTKYHPFRSWQELSKLKPFTGEFYKTDVIEGYLETIRTSKKLRILGISGLGKSRFVIEAFRNPEFSHRVLYLDCSIADNKVAKGLLTRDIFNNFKDAIIVLDNCDTIEFQSYLQLWRDYGSSCTLVAISNNRLEPSMPGVSQLKIDRHLEEVVEKILQQSSLKPDLIIQIKELSGGIPLMGRLMADALKKDKPMGELNDTSIIDKILGEDAESPYRIMLQTLSLFDYIGWEKELRQDLEHVAKNKYITSLDSKSDVVLLNEFDAVIKRGIDKQIIERKGRMIGIRPLPISLFLLKEWWKSCTQDRLQNVFKALRESPSPDALIRAFRNQLSLMDFYPEAEQILQEMLEPGAPFDSAEVINDTIGSQLLRTFADVAPSSVLSLFMRRLSTLPISNLVEIQEGRRELVWTLEKLAFRSEFFDQSAYLLMRLAIAENEKISNNATGQFLSLFPILLASTEVDLNHRLDFLTENSQNPENQKIILRGLRSALKTSDFIYFQGSEKLGRTTRTNHQPSHNEIQAYFEGILSLLCDMASQNESNLRKAADILQDTVIGLCRVGFGDIALKATDQISSLLKNDWDAMYDTLELFKNSIHAYLTKQQLEEYHNLLTILKKTDIVSRFRRIEKDNTKNWKEDTNKIIEREQTEYAELASEFIIEKGYDKSILRQLMMLEPSWSAPFGQTMAKLADADLKKVILRDCIDLVNSIGNINPQIAHDFIAGLTDKEYDESLSEIMTIKNTRLLFGVVGNRGLSDSNKGLPLIDKMVEESRASSSDYIQVYHNLPLRTTTPNDVIAWLDKIKTTDKGTETVLEIGTKMLMFKDSFNDEVLKFFKKFITENKNDYTLTNTVAFWTLANRLLQLSEDPEFSKTISGIILSKLSTPDLMVVHQYLVDETLQTLLTKYFNVLWPMTAKALIHGSARTMLVYNLSTKVYDTYRERGIIDSMAHKEDFIKWCAVYPNEAPQIVISLTGWVGEDGGFSELAKYMLDNYGDNEEMLQELSRQMHSLFSEGSIIPYYLRRKEACESLLKHANPNVRKWATMEVANYESLIFQNKNFEEENF